MAADRLADYRRKRDAAATPEPFDDAPAAASPRFVVQRHDARALHFDLRLEHDGVLASWAVPKGVPLRTGSRRLAVATEDHPLSYLTFAGVIPEGQYGAGRMTVWDHGTYTPLLWSDDERKLVLHGVHLNGEYHMVRTGEKAGKEQWLLFRARAAGPGADDPTPAFRALRPMLATLWRTPFYDPDWDFEIKWDGYRALVLVTGDGVEIRSRSGRDITAEYPELTHLRRALTCQEAVLDGELCVLDDAGRAQFSAIQNHRAPVTLVAFDLLYRDGQWCTTDPVEERRRALRDLVTPDHPQMIIVPDHQPGRGTDLFAAVAAQGIEGIVAKRRGSPYTPGARSPHWRKIKARLEFELTVGGWTQGAGSRRGTFGALLVGEPHADGLHYRGAVGSGMDDAAAAQLAAAVRAQEIPDNPFDVVPDAAGRAHYTRPHLVVRVSCSEVTPDGRLRAPVYHGLAEPGDADPHPDSAEHALTDVAPAPDTDGDADPAETPALDTGAAPAGDPQPDTQVIRDGPRTVRLTNLRKLYWPEEGITKGDMVRHYMAVADALVPHLAGRPMILKRYPHGITGEPFFQHNAPENAPDWLHTVQLGRADDSTTTSRYLTVDDPLALLWVANLGCIDMNPWQSRADTPDCPTHVLFDIDPPDGAPFDVVVEAAQLVHDALTGLGLRGYPKTSGSRGIHVFVPVVPTTSYAVTRGVAETIGAHLAAQRPDLLTTSLPKRGRHGRVFLDANQNARGRSVASVYSLRPRPGAPVSTPLAWDEVRPGLDPRAFDAAAVARRITAHGDLFAPVLDDLQDVAAAVGA